MQEQIELFEEAGAKVEISNDAAARYVGQLLQAIERTMEAPGEEQIVAVDLATIKQPLAGINVGLDSFTESLQAQDAKVVHVDWKPAAGGNEKLLGILDRMKSK